MLKELELEEYLCEPLKNTGTRTYSEIEQLSSTVDKLIESVIEMSEEVVRLNKLIKRRYRCIDETKQ